jgi:hypothetical protein
MKSLKIKIFIVYLICNSIIVNAQFNLIGTGIRTTSGNTKVGIGNFSSLPDINAKLHVNEFHLSTDAATDGRMFRTDGNESQINRWQLFTAPSFSATPTERFSVNALTSGSDVSLLADAAECEILFEQAQMSFKIKKAPVIQITHKKVIIQSEFVLKASDGDNYFVITVNSKGELTTKSIDKKTLFESN